MLRNQHKNISQLVNEQVQQWLQNVREDKGKTPIEDVRAFSPTIAISRQRGSGGWMIGKEIAQRLNFDFFDSTILDFIAKDLNLTREILESVDEQVVTRTEVWINRIFRNRFIEPDDFQKQMVQTVLSIAARGQTVLIGRGAHVIIPPYACFRIRFVAPFDYRVKNVSSILGKTEEEARYDVMKLDRERETFLRKSFDFDVKEPVNFDAIINTSGYDCKSITTFVIEGYRQRFNTTSSDCIEP